MEAKLKNILAGFGIFEPSSITQIHKNAWDIDDTYILKINSDKKQLDKNISLSRLFLSEGIPSVEYILTTDGEPYVYSDEKYWCLMKKIKGICFDPYVGDVKHNGIMLGRAVGVLHVALKNIEIKNEIDIYDCDFSHELSSWILPELERNSVTFNDDVMENMIAFLNGGYKTLPRHIIHRDIHTSNLVFADNIFYYLDFDMSNRNVRIFDIVYLGCSELVENYKDETRLKQWREIFQGILQGYNELLPLYEDEIKAMPMLFVFNEMLLTAFYLKIGELEIAKSCLEMANWLYENIAILIY